MLQGIGKRLLVWLPLCPSWGLLFPPLARLRPWATPIGGTTGRPGRARCHAPWCCGGGSGGGRSDGFEMPCSIFPLDMGNLQGSLSLQNQEPATILEGKLQKPLVASRFSQEQERELALLTGRKRAPPVNHGWELRWRQWGQVGRVKH